MNKLLGFYELRYIGIPSIPWKIFTGHEDLNPGLLWTIRVAVEHGDDFNLPRAVGVSAEVAKEKGNEFLAQLAGKGLVIYYPYFIADKSGIVEVKEHLTIIEGVEKDLWNLTTKGKRDATVLINRLPREITFHGNRDFFKKHEIDELFRYSGRIRVKYKEHIFNKKSVMAEWSYAFNTDINHKPVGERYLVFYECRTVC